MNVIRRIRRLFCDSPRIKGYNDNCEGRPLIENPFPLDTREREEWAEGWKAAEIGDLPAPLGALNDNV